MKYLQYLLESGVHYQSPPESIRNINEIPESCLYWHSKLPCVWWMNGMAEEKGWLLVRESESGGRRKSLFDLMEEGKLQSGFPRTNPILSLLVRSAISPSLPFVTDIPSSLTGQRQIDHPKRPSRGFARNKQSSHIIIESANENFIHGRGRGRPICHSKTRGLGRCCLNRIGK